MSKSNLTEIWRPVVGYEGYYEVSNLGQVHTLARIILGGKGYALRFCKGRILKLQKHRDGHLFIILHRDGKHKTYWIHRLVLEAFIGACPENMQCRHFPDRNPENNNIENLQWGTIQENANDRIVHGTTTKGKSFMTEEGKAKIAQSNRTRVCTDETRKKRSLNAFRLNRERVRRKSWCGRQA